MKPGEYMAEAVLGCVFSTCHCSSCKSALIAEREKVFALARKLLEARDESV